MRGRLKRTELWSRRWEGGGVVEGDGEMSILTHAWHLVQVDLRVEHWDLWIFAFCFLRFDEPSFLSLRLS